MHSVTSPNIQREMFINMIADLLEEAESIMRDNVLLGVDTEWLHADLAKPSPYQDALDDGTAGYTFVDDPRNYTLVHHRLDLYNRMLSDPMYKGRFVSIVDGHAMRSRNIAAFRDWMAACSRLQRTLNLLLHLITAGASQRGVDYESVLIRNTATRRRAIFWRNNTILVVHILAKKFYSHKYVPVILLSLFLKYLCLVRPVQSFVAGILWGVDEERLYSDSWFVDFDRRELEADLSCSVVGAIQRHCNMSHLITNSAMCFPAIVPNRYLDQDPQLLHTYSWTGPGCTFTAGPPRPFRSMSRQLRRRSTI